MPVTVGLPAPDFKLLDENGGERSLAEFRGQPVVLYFYPKDDTPGCTKEACGFRDGYAAYKRAGVVVLGISPDDPKSHTKFKEKFDLPFTLLADTDHLIAEAYGVWALKKFMGREYFGVLRTTFLIDAQGVVAQVFENVKPEGHAEEVLAALTS
jgi:peroxiredoxin Q/BCP